MINGMFRFIKNLAISFIDIYQKYLKPFFPNRSCRFYPSCSQYAKEAIEKFGLLKGLKLFVKRFFKCNQFFSGGIDPVP